ncbi:hypothetical protein [Paenibacillus sp. HGF5]|uniref:imine reductase family protein n=1 Tax=Paenibacillus sp. HGF5 TaxID=908341 RepID=UPI003F8B4E1B
MSGIDRLQRIDHPSSNASLPAAVLEVFMRGVANGHADDSFTSLIEMFKKPL